MVRRTTKSYAGRQLDIELLKHLETATPELTSTPPDLVYQISPDGDREGNPVPRIVAGIEKAAQRYAKLFLTEIGTVKLAPEVGSKMLSSTLSGQVSNLAYFGHLCSVANLHAMLAINGDDESSEFGSMPDDERITDSEITDISLDRAKSRAIVKVMLTTAAGDDYEFVVPVDTGIN